MSWLENKLHYGVQNEKNFTKEYIQIANKHMRKIHAEKSHLQGDDAL